VTPPGGANVAGAASAAERVLEAYRRLIESEDLEALGRELYGGQVPDDDARMLRRIFESAEELQVEMGDHDLKVEGNRAVVDVEYPMRYVLARTKRAQRFTLKLRMTLEAGPSGWRLVALEQR
jgi:hypothetical protein